MAASLALPEGVGGALLTPPLQNDQKEMNKMEFEALIRERRSIRKYKPKPLPHELIREILDEGRWSPSWANTQAWNIYVVTGETLERLKGASKVPTQRQDHPSPDFRMPREWPPHLAERTRQLLDFLNPDAPGAPLLPP